MTRQGRNKLPSAIHSHVVMIHEVVRDFSSIAVDEFNKSTLSQGHSVPASTYKSCTLLRSGLIRNSIGDFSNSPAPCSYFRHSIEDIPRALTTQRGAIDPRAKATRSNAPRGNSSRATQRNNVATIPNIGANETSWI